MDVQWYSQLLLREQGPLYVNVVRRLNLRVRKLD